MNDTQSEIRFSEKLLKELHHVNKVACEMNKEDKLINIYTEKES